MHGAGSELTNDNLDQLFPKSGDIAKAFSIERDDIYQFLVNSANYINMASDLENSVARPVTYDQNIDTEIAQYILELRLELPDFADDFLVHIASRAAASGESIEQLKEKMLLYKRTQDHVLQEASVISQAILRTYVSAGIPEEGDENLKNHQNWVRQVLENPNYFVEHERVRIGMVQEETWRKFLTNNSLPQSTTIPLVNCAAYIYALKQLSTDVVAQVRTPMGVMMTSEFARKAGRMIKDARIYINMLAMELGSVCGANDLGDLRDMVRKSFQPSLTN